MKSGERMTFARFWPYYLREHSNPATRAVHIAGTVAAMACIVAAVISRNPWWIVIALAAGYGPAWFAHFFIEKNRPATFTHPFLSLAGDFTMLGYALRGKLGEEVRKAQGERRP
ncbi:MAG: DUF962 domain-containing protein [Candidatus Eremiobacteraeota bacterium]|nr:DUF962 domain-containing protein [Candidatus Eremiobacteraeota bacterium]